MVVGCRIMRRALILFSWLALASAIQAREALPLQVDLDAFDGMKRVVELPNGLHLAYVEWGSTAGPPTVLIHGYTDSARDWVPLLPYLAGRRLIVVDLRGHGRSDKPECCYTRVDFAYDIKLLLDQLHIEQADLVGHSLGSMIAQVFAETWPERTRRVVLISSTAGPPAGALPRKPKFDFASAIRNLKEPLSPDSPFMIAWWASPTPVDPEFNRRQRVDAAAMPLSVWRAVLDQGMNYADLKSGLPRLTAPVLLIWGSEDPIMEPDARVNLIHSLPRAKVKIFAGLGHNPFWEEPREVASAINRFLDSR